MRTSSTIRFSAALLLSVGIAVWLPAGLSVALAQTSDKGLEFLTRASSAFESGDFQEAATYIEEAMKTGLSKDLSARATLMRAQINEHNGLLARALQDYSTVLWMDTLPPKEKKRAAEGKERVIAAMGLNTPAPANMRQASAASAPPPSPPAETSSALLGFSLFSSSPAATPSPPPAPQPASSGSSSGGVFGMFNGLFGSSSPQPQPAEPTAQPQATWQTAAAPATTVQPKVDATEPIQANVPRKAAKQAPVQPTAVKPASLQPASLSSPDNSGFLIVFGAAPSEAAGQARARQIKTQVADILVSRQLDVEAGGDGSYRITAGPYKAKSAAIALCSAMKQRGVSCQVTP